MSDLNGKIVEGGYQSRYYLRICLEKQNVHENLGQWVIAISVTSGVVLSVLKLGILTRLPKQRSLLFLSLVQVGCTLFCTKQTCQEAITINNDKKGVRACVGVSDYLSKCRREWQDREDVNRPSVAFAFLHRLLVVGV